MDLAYWGFSRWPFQRQQAADSSIVGASHEEGLARLLFLVDEHRRCGLLSGATGTGKTCLFRRAASYARRQGKWCLEIDATGLDADELAWRMADQLLADCSSNMTPGRCWTLIQQQLANQALIGQPVVAVIDNLDHAERGSSLAIRRMMNLAESSGAELTVLIAARGQLPDSSLSAEIELSVELTGWSQEETSRFVTTSLRAAGTTIEIFSADAIIVVQEITQGNPKSVIQVCDLSLMAAMSDDRHHVDAQVVEAATAEFAPRRSTPDFVRARQPALS